MALITNLISYWKLDESSGDAIDVHGDNDGTVVTATQDSVGKIDKAYTFDGINDYISVASDPSIEGMAALTLAAWVNPTDDGSSGYSRIIHKLQGTTTDDYALSYTSGDKVALRINTNLGYVTLLGGTTVWPNTGWYHFAATWDGDNMIVYLNGVSDGTGNRTGTLDDSNLAMGIGGSTTSGTRRFTGLVDEVGIWSRALDGDEIAELYNSDDGLAYPFSPSSSSSSFSSSSSSSSWSSSSSSSSFSSSSSSFSSSSSSSSFSSSSSSSWSSDPTKDYSRGDYAVLPLNDDDLEHLLTGSEYTDILTDNDVYVGQTATGQFAIFLSKNQGADDKGIILVECKAKSDLAPSSSTVYLQIYNRNSGDWENLDSDNVTAADTEFPLSGIQSANLGYYYDANYWVVHRIYQKAE